jgi:Type IV secretion system pilin
MSNFLTKIFLLFSLSICLISFNLLVIAQEQPVETAPTQTVQKTGDGYTPLDPCTTLGNSCIKGIDQFQSRDGEINGILAFLQAGINIATYIAVPISVIFIIIGGYNIINAQGDEKKYASGLSTVQYAIAGFVIILLAGTIIGLIIGFSKSDLNSQAGNENNQATQNKQNTKPNQSPSPDNTVTTAGGSN